MAVSKAQQRAVTKYDAKAYDKTLLRLPKGKLNVVKAHVTAHSESVNGFINRAIDQAMEREGGGIPPKIAQQAAEGPSSGGVISLPLPSDTLEAAQRAAEAVGEAVPDFVARAVTTQAQRDKSSLRLGINPATGEKLKKEV